MQPGNKHTAEVGCGCRCSASCPGWRKCNLNPNSAMLAHGCLSHWRPGTQLGCLHCTKRLQRALSALIRGWEEGKLLSGLSDSHTAGRSSEPCSGNSQKEKLQCKTSRPGI